MERTLTVNRLTGLLGKQTACWTLHAGVAGTCRSGLTRGCGALRT